MPKKQANSKTKKSQSPACSQSPPPPRIKKQKGKSNIGRPEDDEMEIHFMQKLRNGKLQVINAESYAQIICHKFEDSRAKVRSESNVRKERVDFVVGWFQSIDQVRFHKLLYDLNESSKKWQFDEVTSIKDFPEFLFCDESDMSYVLHSLLNPTRQQFKNDELLFLELLCFANRDMISMRVLKSIKQNFDLGKMSHVKAAVEQLSKELSSTVKRPQVETQKQMEPQLPQGDVSEEQRQVEASGNMPQKNKKIQKNKKDKKKQGKSKNQGNDDDDEQLLTSEQLQQVTQKLITHIINSYAYIYCAEQRLKKTVEATVKASTSEKGIECRLQIDQ